MFNRENRIGNLLCASGRNLLFAKIRHGFWKVFWTFPWTFQRFLGNFYSFIITYTIKYAMKSSIERTGYNNFFCRIGSSLFFLQEKFISLGKLIISKFFQSSHALILVEKHISFWRKPFREITLLVSQQSGKFVQYQTRTSSLSCACSCFFSRQTEKLVQLIFFQHR